MQVLRRFAKVAALISLVLHPLQLLCLEISRKPKRLAKEAGCPVIPGSEGVVLDLKTALQEAKQLGYPIFIKAVAGGRRQRDSNCP